MFLINEFEYVHADQLTLSEHNFKLLLKSCYIHPDYELHTIFLVLFAPQSFLTDCNLTNLQAQRDIKVRLIRAAEFFIPLVKLVIFHYV